MLEYEKEKPSEKRKATRQTRERGPDVVMAMRCASQGCEDGLPHTSHPREVGSYAQREYADTCRFLFLL